MALELLLQYLCLHYYLDVQHCTKLVPVKDGDVIPKLLVDSPDGFIKIDHNPTSRNCCEPDILNIRGDNIALELKSPYPQPEKIPVHYSVPRWYVLQILIHMFVTDSEYAWYGCCGTKSVVS